MAAVLEYIVGEIIESARYVAEDHKKKALTPRHIQLAIRGDDALSKLFAKTTINLGGVLPHIENVLLPKKHQEKAEGTQQM